MNAIRNIRYLCETHLSGNHHIEIIDLLTHPRRAIEDQLIAIPTLIRCLPRPAMRIVGDLSLHEKVLTSLNITPKDSRHV